MQTDGQEDNTVNAGERVIVERSESEAANHMERRDSEILEMRS